jgi:hypothetical protein
MAQARRNRVILLFALGLAGLSPFATARPARPAGGGAGALPDTVLARVGATREVTVSRFLDAWRRVEPPARPDSLTPEGAGRFLQLLIGREALGEAALRERWTWTPAESAAFEGLRDHLVMRAELDSALEATRRDLAAAGGRVASPDSLGIIARDRVVARLGARFDEPLLARLARAFAAMPRPSPDSSIAAQLRALGAMPEIDAPDTERVAAETSAGPYTVAALLEGWRRLSPAYRPRIEDPDQVRDLVKNGLYERELRRDAARRRLDARPDIAAALDARREENAVRHLVAREVYEGIAGEPGVLERFYRDHPDRWSLPTRARITRLLFADRRDATRMALRLRDPAAAESLLARGARSGADYATVVSEAEDSAAFRRALDSGAGTVAGPDSVAGGWEVSRVNEILPGRERGFAEARPLVEDAWYRQESARRMEALIERTRARTRIAINRRSLARLDPGGLTTLPRRP